MYIMGTRGIVPNAKREALPRSFTGACPHVANEDKVSESIRLILFFIASPEDGRTHSYPFTNLANILRMLVNSAPARAFKKNQNRVARKKS
jgi:hypothetical protein